MQNPWIYVRASEIIPNIDINKRSIYPKGGRKAKHISHEWTPAKKFKRRSNIEKTCSHRYFIYKSHN